jgi:hypothetical protein
MNALHKMIKGKYLASIDDDEEEQIAKMVVSILQAMSVSLDTAIRINKFGLEKESE